MIQAYRKNNNNFEKNAETVIHPESCKLTCELNGAWTLNITHPKDNEGRWKGIEEEGVISAPTFMGEKQLFRINEIERTNDSIDVVAYPIFLDSADDCFIIDTRPEGKTGQEALDILMKGSKYSGKSDIKTVSTAYFIRRNLIDAINGNSSPTFVQRWGGEILYDNYKVIINNRVGADSGVEIRYGKNLEEIEQHIDYSNVVTRIVPISYNGHTLDKKHPWVDSPLIKNYAKIYTKEIKFDDVQLQEDVQGEVEEGTIVCSTLPELRAELKKKCEEQYANGIDKPSISITCSMVDLSQTEEYKNFKNLEQVSLGDTVHCINSDLGILIDARVVNLEYDCILKKIEKITIGKTEYNFFDDAYSTVDRVDQAIRTDGTLIGQQVMGIINGVKAQLKAQSTVAQKQAVRAVMFEDLDPSSPTFGAMCIGTLGFEIASERTEDGRDWKWSTFGTGQGFFADYIVAGTMLADRIRGGLLELGGWNNKNGIFKICDDNGDQIGYWSKDGIVLSKGTIAGPDITVGGQNNQDGTLKVLDAAGNQIATVGSEGLNFLGINGWNRKVQIKNGTLCLSKNNGSDPFFLDYSGSGGIIFRRGGTFEDVSGAKVLMRLMDNSIWFDADKVGPDGYAGKTGRVEFSDGTYLDVRKGNIIGGNTKEGTF
jgi:phage minor structural protein